MRWQDPGKEQGQGAVGTDPSPAKLFSSPVRAGLIAAERATADCCTGIKLGELKTRINHRHAYLHMKHRHERFMVINIEWLIKVH